MHAQFGEGRLEKDLIRHLAGRLLYYNRNNWGGLPGQSQQATQAPPAETAIEQKLDQEAVAAKPDKLASRLTRLFTLPLFMGKKKQKNSRIPIEHP